MFKITVANEIYAINVFLFMLVKKRTIIFPQIVKGKPNKNMRWIFATTFVSSDVNWSRSKHNSTIKSDVNITWELVSTQNDGSRLISVYRCMSNTNLGAQNTSIYFNGNATKSAYIALYEYTNTQSGGNGLNAIKQVVSA